MRERIARLLSFAQPMLVTAAVLSSSTLHAAQTRANDSITLEQARLTAEGSRDQGTEGSSGAVTDDSLPELPVAVSTHTPEHLESQPLGEQIEFLGNPNETHTLGTAADESIAPIGSASGESDRSGLAALQSEAGHIIQVIGALIVVIALIFLTRFAMLRTSSVLGGAGRPSGVLEVLARYPIARGQTLVLVKMARRILLVHQSSTGMTTLSEISDPDEVASLLSRIQSGSSGRDQHRFSKLLEQFQQQHVKAERSGHLRTVPHSAASDESEIVDLTRRRSGGFGRLFGGGR